MYFRTTRVKRPNGHVDEYIRLVESYWNDGRPRHRIICNLGRKEILAPHADALMRILRGEEKSATNPDAEAVGGLGPILVARHFWQELGLQRIIDGCARPVDGREEVTDRALALVTNRLCEPTSEHGIARWLETDYVCNRTGTRWLPEWREDAERLASKRPRVRVKDRQLRQWYGTLDPGAQRRGSRRTVPLVRKFDLAVTGFYDLTSVFRDHRRQAGISRSRRQAPQSADPHGPRMMLAGRLRTVFKRNKRLDDGRRRAEGH
jgi:hypothetical protein